MRTLLTAAICLLFFGCAKKTRVIENSKISDHINAIVDSMTKRDLLTRDKSITKTTIDLDTLISLTGIPLTGVLDTDEIVKHFENNDLSIDFKRDHLGRNIVFIATPKSKTINAKYHKNTYVQNDIVKSEKQQSQVKKKSQIEQDSTHNNLIDHRDSTSSISGIKSIIIWSVVLLTLAMGCYYAVKKKLI